MNKVYCMCNNTAGVLLGQKMHFVLSPPSSNQDVEGSLEDSEKALRISVSQGKTH